MVIFLTDPTGQKNFRICENILIFYCEYGNFNLLEDLTYIMQMKDVYENPPNNIPKDRWLNMRQHYKYWELCVPLHQYDVFCCQHYFPFLRIQYHAWQKLQLFNLQGLSYAGAGSFLTGEGWSRNEEYANQTGRYFGYNLDYNVAVWQKRNTNYIESKLYLYTEW